MSRSYKKAILKDKGSKKLYWKTIRRVIKHIINKNRNYPKYQEELNYGDPEEFGWDEYIDEKGIEDQIPDPKIIIDDYNYCDYIIDMEHDDYYKNRRDKYRRK